ncbi:MAG: GNAT family N-acetyltransferase [Ruminococcus callidus]
MNPTAFSAPMMPESVWQRSHSLKQKPVSAASTTFVDDSLRGMGIAGEIGFRAVQQIQANGKQVTATCSMRRTGWKSKRKRQKCIRILKSRLFYS